MSDDASLKEIVVEEATDQLDVADLVGDGDVEDGIDAEAIGASVGGRLGERIGRSAGEAAGDALREAVSREGDGEDQSVRGVVADVFAAVRDAIVGTLSGDRGESVVSSARETVSEASDAVEERTPDADSTDAAGTDEEERGGDGTEEAAEEGDAEPDEGDGSVPDADEGAGPSTEDLENLRRETLEDFLEVLSYRDLQSVAKDVDVRANLAREEMTERIVDAVTDGTGEES